MSGYIDPLSRRAYELGMSPLDWAEQTITSLIKVHAQVAASRDEDPGSFPGYCIEPGTAPLSRRILGALLNAGWTMPELGQETRP